MSSRHGGQSMSHPIITLYSVWCISQSNSWSISLVLIKAFMKKIDLRFPYDFHKPFRKHLSIPSYWFASTLHHLDRKHQGWFQYCCLHGELPRKHSLDWVYMRIDRRILQKIPTQHIRSRESSYKQHLTSIKQHVSNTN